MVRAALSYLTAEWVGALLAYAVALFAFAFLIGYLVVAVAPRLIGAVPLVAILAGAGLLMLWKALDVPRALLRLARNLPTTRVGVSSLYFPPGPSIPGSAVEWRATRMVDRLNAVRAADESWVGARSGAMPIDGAKLRILDLAPTARLRPPDRDLLPVYSRERRIPVLIAEQPAHPGAIRIVDLAEDTNRGWDRADE